MPNSVLIENKINKFNKVITVSGDKSLSIRWVLLSSLANGVSKAKNLLISEDVLSALKTIKKLGINSIIKKMSVKFMAEDLGDTNIKKI